MKQKALLGILIMIIAALLAGCVIQVSDPVDVRSLARYRNIKPGMEVNIVLNVGIEGEGMQMKSLANEFQVQGVVAVITKDTIGLRLEENGRSWVAYYAGRMIREMQIVKRTPNQPSELTPTTVTPAASAPVAPAVGAAHL